MRISFHGDSPGMPGIGRLLSFASDSDSVSVGRWLAMMNDDESMLLGRVIIENYNNKSRMSM